MNKLHLIFNLPRQQCLSPPDLATVLIFNVMEVATLSPCVDQMKCSLTVTIVKENILECHLQQSRGT